MPKNMQHCIRRVRLGLLQSEIGSANSIEVSQQE
jgi:hypothetical protein